MVFLIFFSAFLISVSITPFIIIFAKRCNVLDHPSGIKTHSKPVPYLGGAAIYIAFLILCIAWSVLKSRSIEDIQGILLGASVIFLLGLVDDIKKLSIPTKFLWQILASVILIAHGIQTQFLPYDWLNIIISILWVVGITNAFNILDIMDGLASGVAWLIALSFAMLAIGQNMLQETVMASVLAGSILGFLVYNYPPAKIFLGDAGSLFIGFTIGSLAMTGRYSEKKCNCCCFITAYYTWNSFV